MSAAAFGVLLCLGLVGSASSQSGVCPAGSIYNAQLDKCYTYVNSPQQFTIAEQSCAGLGGHLTTVRNGFENTLLQENAAQIFTSAGNNTDFWLGGSDLSIPDTWAWNDGQPFTYSNWAAGYPQAVSGADCISDQIRDSKWRNVDCFSSRPFVCQVPQLQLATCPPPPTCPTLTCPSPPPCTPRVCPGNCPSEWTYYGPTDNCYRVFYGAKWDDAEAVCVQQGSHLASIHSELENTFVARLASARLKLDTDRMTWIGLHSVVQGQWIWSDGSPADYINWAPKQPDNPNKEYCVQIYSDQDSASNSQDWYEKWNNYPCGDNMRAYVCKMAANH